MKNISKGTTKVFVIAGDANDRAPLGSRKLSIDTVNVCLKVELFQR